MSRIDDIQNFARRKAETDKKKAEELQVLIEGYRKKILDLKPRIDEILEVGNACLQNGIPLSVELFNHNESYDAHQFITNGWSHLLGFVSEKDRPFRRIGIEGGGVCDFNLTTDGVNISVSGKDIAYVLKRFIDEFDTFETSFYAYVDKVVRECQK